MIRSHQLRGTLGALVLSASLVFIGCDSGSKDAGADSGATPTADKSKPDKPGLDKSKMLADASDAKGDPGGGEFDGFDPRVVKAASIAKDIEADPAKADAVLEERGLDREGLDSLMFEIARDPDLTGQYRIARGL